jgi:alanine-synthesizing transaminase
LRPVQKSNKLNEICYEIRGPVPEKARLMEEEGHKVIKLNIGNMQPFGFDPPDEIVHDMIVNLPNAAGYTDSKGMFAPRKAVMHYTQQKKVANVTMDDIYLGNGASELIVMSMNALLNNGDEVLVPAPDYPLWTAAVSLSGGKPVHYVCDEAQDRISTTCAGRSRPIPRRSWSSTRTTRPARCIRTRCCCRLSNWRASTS